MKTIDKERLLLTLRHIGEWHNRINGWNGEVVSALASHGLQSTFNKALGVNESLTPARIDLELTVLEARKDPATLQKILDTYFMEQNAGQRKPTRSTPSKKPLG